MYLNELVDIFKRNNGAGYLDYCKQLAREGRVRFEFIQEGFFIAHVREGGRDHRVELRYDTQRATANCSCARYGECIHLIIAVLAAQEQRMDKLQTAQKWDVNWMGYLQQISLYTEPKSKVRAGWFLIYVIDLYEYSFSIKPAKVRILKNGGMGRITDASMKDLNQNSIGEASDRMVLMALHSIDERGAYQIGTHAGRDRHYYGFLPGELFDFITAPVYYRESEDDGLIGPLSRTRKATIKWQVRASEEQFSVQPVLTMDSEEITLDEEWRILSKNPAYAIYKEELIHIQNLEVPGAIITSHHRPLSLSIKKGEFDQFLGKGVRMLQQIMPVDCSKLTNKRVEVKEMGNCFLDVTEDTQELRMTLWFGYGDYKLRAGLPVPVWHTFNAETETLFEIHRDVAGENAAMTELESRGLRPQENGVYRLKVKNSLPWLLEHSQPLEKLGFVFEGLDELKHFRIRTSMPRIQIDVSSAMDWFDLKLGFSYDGVVLSNKELYNAIRDETSVVKLTDGSFARLPQAWQRKLQYLRNIGEWDAKKARVHRSHITMIDLLSETGEEVITDKEVRRLQKKLKSFQSIETQEVPKGLTASLRSYQKAGYDWLCFLQQFGFGGCLADDMGLGKTIQALALLQREKERKVKLPSLVICPTSLIYNWQEEASRFAPDLKVHIHYGSERDRKDLHFNGVDLLLTTYGVMIRDAEWLQKIRFHYLILDESQRIKNPASQAARAVKAFQAAHRLVLTGTPVENNTVELWSQFSFINPGLLGNLTYFKKAFAVPIEKDKNRETATALRKLVYPFIFRRKKQDVAKELPARHEQIIHCDMQPEQEKLYHSVRDEYRRQLLEKIDLEGMDRARMHVLEGLIRLRQIACHPLLMKGGPQAESGKFNLLKDSIGEIIAENHKVLVFSQFVKMLKIMRHYFDEEGLRYEYLDGSTRDRKRAVDQFQTDEEVKLFLISLRAGGTGLNLTAADYVILFDPWWNPAVEMQAADRAHRIGQEKPVFIYRYIARDTVEEKMLLLQEQKKELVSQLVSTEQGVFKNLTRADVEMLFS